EPSLFCRAASQASARAVALRALSGILTSSFFAGWAATNPGAIRHTIPTSAARIISTSCLRVGSRPSLLLPLRGLPLGDVHEVLLDHRRVLRRQLLRHRLAQQLALPRRQVDEQPAAAAVAGAALLVAPAAVGHAVAVRALVALLPAAGLLALGLALAL